MTPSQEQVCSGLHGAAFGLCNAYCEAQDCDVHARPSCAQLRKNFARVTGSPNFPCDAFCGDGKVDQRTEECDPPGLPCDDQRICGADCTCPEPVCGDGIVDPGEECDPPAAPCANDPERTCRNDCTCPEPLCGNGIIDPGEVACRFDVRNTSMEACTRDQFGNFRFASSMTQKRFCAFILVNLSFQNDDTLVTARAADNFGNVGNEGQLIIRR